MGEDKCVSPAKGPIQIVEGADAPQIINDRVTKEAPKMTARVGKPAIDFEANAFMDGGFKNLKLSDYKGKWIILCFYPGDFTFV